MKLRLFNVLNAAVANAINSARGAWQEMSLREGEKESRYLFVRYGEYPVTFTGDDGRPRRGIQVVDEQCARELQESYSSLNTKFATFFKGIPVFEGHADDAAWLEANPGHKAAAVGRIKEIGPGAEGIEVRTVFNTRGVEMLSGEAPEYSGHSPHWRIREIPDRPGYFRPFLLWSDALTNDPNMPECGMPALNQSPPGHQGADGEPDNNNDMKLTPEALKALGFAPDATPTEAEISAAIVKLLGEKTTADAAKATAEGALNVANTRNTTLQTELDGLRGTSVANAINSALTAGKITEADKPEWEKILKADFTSGSKLLEGLKGNDALNSRNHLGDMSKRAGEGDAAVAAGYNAMNTAAKEYAKANDIDISTREGWTQAWNGAAAAKPEVFKQG